MIYVREYNDQQFAVQFPPIQDNLKRIRSLPGATFDGEKSWRVPLAYLEEFEDAFRGEFIFVTPRHVLTGDPPPPPPRMYEKIPKLDVPRIKPPWKLYDYQKFGANFLALIAKGTGHAFLTDTVGSGKTLQAIAGAHLLQEEGLVNTVIVFCKASLKYQWLRDGVEKFTTDEGIVIDGTKAQRKKLYEQAKDAKYRYVIVNYELLLHDFDELSDIVKAKNINLMLADEAHKVVNPKGKTNNALAKLVQKNPKTKHPGIAYVFYLTATPLSSRLEQIYGLFSIRRPDFFGKFSEFSKKHLIHTHKGRATKLVGYKDIDGVRAKTWKYMLRRTANEIDMELPEKVEIFKRLRFTSLQKKLDDLAKAEMESLGQRLDKLNQTMATPEETEALEGALKGMIYVRKALCDDPNLLTKSKSPNIRGKFGNLVLNDKERDKSPKWDELKDILEEVVVENNEKIIVFSELETMVQLLRERIQNEGHNCVIYTGKMSAHEKDQAVQKFREDPDCNIFIATDAAAEGINLQVAGYIVNYDLPWNADTYVQRNGRIQRGGSTYKKVKVFNLMVEDGIDPAVWEGIVKKQNLIDFMVENTEEQSAALKKAMYG